MCRYISKLRLLAVALEDTSHGRLHVGSGPRLLTGRQRVPGTKQRHIETDVKGRGKHSVVVRRLTGFATYPAVLHLKFPCRLAGDPPAEGRAASCSAPEFELSRLREIQL